MTKQNPFGHRGNLTVEIKTTPAESLDLLQKLATDDELRARFKDDPHKVLRQHGIHVPADLLPKELQLPPKEDIAATLQSLSAREAVSVASHNHVISILGSAAFLGFFFPGPLPHIPTPPRPLSE